MARRATHSGQVGSAGISEVIAEFERLGWGPVENPRHDLGIDLFLQVRDERRYDTGLIVGAQVKSGRSYFEEPAREDGELVGWWFRDDHRDHVDSWLDHSLPVLIILRDLEARISHWAHITRDSVISTGTGAKVLVPIANVRPPRRATCPSRCQPAGRAVGGQRLENKRHGWGIRSLALRVDRAASGRPASKCAT